MLFTASTGLCVPVAALEPIMAGTRDARDARIWFDQQPRGEGAEAAGFHWQPTLPLGLRYDDNIFASDARDFSDGIFSIAPSVRGKAALQRHAFTVTAYSRSDFYFDQTAQDNTEYGAAAYGRLDVYDWLAFSARYRFDQLTENWDSPEVSLAAAEQSDVLQVESQAAVHFKYGRFWNTDYIRYIDVTYDDVTDRAGALLIQDHRNRDPIDLGFEFGYVLNAMVQPYVRLVWRNQGYDNAPPRALADRDGSGRSYLGGFKFRFENGPSGDIYAGYIKQDYVDDDPNLEIAQGVGFGADIDWELTSTTALRLEALREIEEATTGFESGRFTSTVLFGARHSLSDRLALDARVGFENNEYVGTPRSEDTWLLRIGGKLDLGSQLFTALTWDYASRDSNAQGRSYDGNAVLFSVGWAR